jgi:hypothetical protein
VSTHLLAVVVGIPVAWLVGLAAFTYYDAGRVGMDRRKWAAVALLVPLFGFFLYLFERSERSYDPEEDPYAGGGYNTHPSRDDGAYLSGGNDDDAHLSGEDDPDAAARDDPDGSAGSDDPGW